MPGKGKDVLSLQVREGPGWDERLEDFHLDAPPTNCIPPLSTSHLLTSYDHHLSHRMQWHTLSVAKITPTLFRRPHMHLWLPAGVRLRFVLLGAALLVLLLVLLRSRSWRRQRGGGVAAAGRLPGRRLGPEFFIGVLVGGASVAMLVIIFGGSGRSGSSGGGIITTQQSWRMDLKELPKQSEAAGGLVADGDGSHEKQPDSGAAAPAVVKPSLETIFVSVASYRDSECAQMIGEMFAAAEFPARVFVGAVEQNKDEDECCTNATLPFNSHVRVKAIPHTEAQGPTYARYLGSLLYQVLLQNRSSVNQNSKKLPDSQVLAMSWKYFHWYQLPEDCSSEVISIVAYCRGRRISCSWTATPALRSTGTRRCCA